MQGQECVTQGTVNRGNYFCQCSTFSFPPTTLHFFLNRNQSTERKDPDCCILHSPSSSPYSTGVELDEIFNQVSC